MPRYALELEFAGAAFNGTQVQDHGRTLQGVVAQTLVDLVGHSVDLRPGSRLDQGVSARALPSDVRLDRDWDPVVLGLALNQKLPKDIIVRRVAGVADGFDARRDSVAKAYRYRVLVRPTRPVLDHAALWIRHLPHPERLADLAALIPGRHDLSGFACLRHDETDVKDPVRDYLTARWSAQPCGDEADGSEYTFRIRGAGFLYKQVRGLVGAMVHVAAGRATVDDFMRAMADGRAATRLANIAPAEGLLLERAEFTPEPDWRVVDPRGRVTSPRSLSGIASEDGDADRMTDPRRRNEPR